MENNQGNIKLYSIKDITFGTALGSPLVAGFLMRKNFINLGKSKEGNICLIACAVFTAFMFWGLISLPDNIIDRIPNVLIPAIYAGIIYWIAEKLMGKAIKEHEANNLPFYSRWKTLGISLICCLIIVIPTVYFMFFYGPSYTDKNKYDNAMELFEKNERDGLGIYTLLEQNAPSYKLVYQIDSVDIPAWKKNIEILESLNTIEDLSEKIIQQNTTLKNISTTRIEFLELLKKAIIEDTDIYNNKIDSIDYQLGILIEKTK
ncbi:hypothetical protein FACS189413_06030 [Bacteroidia bacterium]|nr:hypothetical protein FACS189413_06030 [Bacteroidia bacterium]